MNTSKLTEKAQEAIVAAQRLAEDRHHTQLEPEHLLVALVTRRTASSRPCSSGSASPRGPFAKGSNRRSTASRGLRPDPGLRLEPLPPRVRRRRQGGRAAEGRLRLDRALPAGPGRRPRPAPPARPCAGWASPATGVYQALQEVRGGQRVTSQNPETTYQSLEKYGRDLTALARAGQARPGHRPRRGDPPHDPGPVAADQEQPGADRRAGRRQDRHRRGAGPAHRPRRRARGAQGQARSSRSTWARSSPAPSTAASSRSGSRRCSRRSPSPTGRSSCSSTSCTPSSARARPRARWTPRTCSSRCWPAASCTASARRRSTSTASTSRRTPRWSGASSRSSSASRRSRTPSRSCAACASATSSTTGPDQGRGAGRGGRPLPPLHRRPLPARQGDRPGRRGRRQAAHGSHQHAGRARRGPAPDHAARDRARGPAKGEGPGLQGAAGELEQELANLKEQAAELEARWQASWSSSTRSAVPGADRRRSATNSSRRARAPTGSAPPACSTRSATSSSSWTRPRSAARAHQDGRALVKEEVDEEDIAEVVSRWTGIPVSRCWKARSRS